MDIHTENDKKRALTLYAFFGASLLLGLIPQAIATVVSLVFLIISMVYAYKLRRGDDVAANHAAFILQTIWVATIVSLLSLVAGSIYLIPNINYASFAPCDQALEAGQELLELYPCFATFIAANMNVLVLTALITAAPIALYLIVRFIRGLSRAMKGYRIANPKSWL